jgi:hypothetical protein
MFMDILQNLSKNPRGATSLKESSQEKNPSSRWFQAGKNSQHKGPPQSKPPQEGSPTSSNNQFEFLGNLDGSVNPEDMEKEVEKEEELIIDPNSRSTHLDNNIDPSFEDPRDQCPSRREGSRRKERRMKRMQRSQRRKKRKQRRKKKGNHIKEEEKEVEPEAQVHFESSKSFSFVEILKNAPNPSPPLTRGRKSNRDQITYEAKMNILLGC